MAHIVAGKILGVGGEFGRAIEAFSKAHLYSHGNTEAVGLKGYTLGASGRTVEARRLMRDLKRRAQSRYVPSVHEALVHLGLGDREGVFAALDHAIEERDVRLTFLAVEPRWATLWGEPRFDSIRAQIGLPSEPQPA